MIELVIGLNQMISSGNFSATFAPVDDHLYPGQTKFFHDSPKSALQKGNFKKVLKCKKCYLLTVVLWKQTSLHWTWKWVCPWPQNSMLLKIFNKGVWSCCDTTMKTKRLIFEN